MRLLKAAIIGNIHIPNFEPEEVMRRYRRDRLSQEEWLLAYNDRFTKIFHRFGAIGFPFLIFSVTIGALDFWHNDGKFTIKTYGELYDHVVDAGYATAVPIALMVVIAIVMLRGLSVALFRIYQNRANPNRLWVLTSYGPFFKRWREVDRSDIERLPTLYNQGDMIKTFMLGGHIRVADRPFILNDTAFLNNHIRAYILGENNRIPSAIKSGEISSQN